jgi:hypothetical protein
MHSGFLVKTALFLLLALGALAQVNPPVFTLPAVPRVSETVVINHVAVIDVTSGSIQSDMTVVVRNGRISSISPAGRGPKSAGAKLVEGGGRFLIPGLWDMHVHSVMSAGTPDWTFPLFIANGVVGVRDMHGDLELGKEMSKEIADGKRIGPRVFLSSCE